jgi:hypothetical protein
MRAGPLIGSRDVGVRGALGGVRGQPGASRYGQNCGQMGCPTGDALLTADYETRMREFDNVETATPVVSLPVESSDLDDSDLKVTPPGGQSG